MSFLATVASRESFDDWVVRQRGPATEPGGEVDRRGRELFFANGCALCHTVRGHGAWGRAGPDLTHVGSRLTIGAGLVDNTPENLVQWIAHNDALKRGNRMPDYSDLRPETLHAIARYLGSLE